jgi:hypothetical protein
VYHYRVKNLKYLIEIIIPFFEQYPLQTNKKFELVIFKQLCLKLQQKEHLIDANFEEIQSLVQQLSKLKKG